MAEDTTSSDEIEEIWATVVEKDISCVEDDSPSETVLAHYLGRRVENKYRVGNVFASIYKSKIEPIAT